MNVPTIPLIPFYGIRNQYQSREVFHRRGGRRHPPVPLPDNETSPSLKNSTVCTTVPLIYFNVQSIIILGDYRLQLAGQ